MNQFGEFLEPITNICLPNQLDILEVWTGPENTIVMDSEFHLWASGWNDHGNLGDGNLCPSSSWVKVLNADGTQVRLLNPWTESVACGGAHVICQR